MTRGDVLSENSTLRSQCRGRLQYLLETRVTLIVTVLRSSSLMGGGGAPGI